MEFEYPGGITVFSQCRQINGCDNIVGEFVAGTKGSSNCTDRIESKGGSGRWRYRGPSSSPYHQEHQDLIASILAGQPINEARTIAESTLTGILGREAVYSGHAITWDEAMKSKTRLGPSEYKFVLARSRRSPSRASTVSPETLSPVRHHSNGVS